MDERGEGGASGVGWMVGCGGGDGSDDGVVLCSIVVCLLVSTGCLLVSTGCLLVSGLENPWQFPFFVGIYIHNYTFSVDAYEQTRTFHPKSWATWNSKLTGILWTMTILSYSIIGTVSASAPLIENSEHQTNNQVLR